MEVLLSGLRPRVYRKVQSLRALLAFPVQEDQTQKLQQAERRLRDQNEKIRKQRVRLEKQRRELEELRALIQGSVHETGQVGLEPENIVWIFGTARTGSTWLMQMMEELEGQIVWREPYVGELFGRFYNSWAGAKHLDTKHLILSRRYKESWLRSLRRFVLSEASVRFPEAVEGGYLVVKEPNGAAGVPLLMEAMPESRMIFLLRDPRDVVASSLDAFGAGSWLHERRVEEGGRRTEVFGLQADAVAERTANRYLEDITGVNEAYDAHQGPKTIVKYEDLRADTLGTMHRLYTELGIDVDLGELARAVEEHAWENVPEDRKGEGKFHRKARPGGWREDLTEEQARTVERITAPLLKEFYSDQG
jgi:hypothetical protein